MASKEEVRALLSPLLEKEGLNDADIEVATGSQKGDGYMSVMIQVNIKGADKALNLILKCSPKAKEIREMMPVGRIFLREIYFYDAVAPALANFQHERCVNEPFDGFVKCYMTVSDDLSETIVMDNIKEQGFVLYNRRIEMDEAHIKFVLKEYGKFHAISFAMQDQDMELYKKLTNNLEELFPTVGKDFLDEMKLGFNSVIALFAADGDQQIRKALQNFQDNIFAEFFDSLNGPNKYNAISQGDCWCNNMMFKYEAGSSAPSQVRLLDFQISRYNSPVMDLSNFIYGSAKKEIYNNLEHYLKIYYKSFSDHMKALGSDAEKMYPFNELTNDWRHYYKYGFLLATVIFKAAIKDGDDLVDLTDMAVEGKGFSEMFSVSEKGKAVTDKRTRDLVLHLFESGYLH